MTIERINSETLLYIYNTTTTLYIDNDGEKILNSFKLSNWKYNNNNLYIYDANFKKKYFLEILLDISFGINFILLLEYIILFIHKFLLLVSL